MRTKKVKSTGRFGARYGSVVKERFRAIEDKQRQRQQCPFCSKYSAKRLAKGIWLCKGCGKKFALHAYYLK
jgi:large subunit ribosomal protein L37Ae